MLAALDDNYIAITCSTLCIVNILGLMSNWPFFRHKDAIKCALTTTLDRIVHKITFFEAKFLIC